MVLFNLDAQEKKKTTTNKQTKQPKQTSKTIHTILNNFFSYLEVLRLSNLKHFLIIEKTAGLKYIT